METKIPSDADALDLDALRIVDLRSQKNGQILLKEGASPFKDVANVLARNPRAMGYAKLFASASALRAKLAAAEKLAEACDREIVEFGGSQDVRDALAAYHTAGAKP